MDRVDIARLFTDLSLEAGAAILSARARGLDIRHKPGAGPVTDADLAAERVILEGLARRLGDVPVIAEEAYGNGVRPAPGNSFILVDALDGTKGFIAGGDAFTVNIALVCGQRPVVGVVHAPALGELFVGIHDENARSAFELRAPDHAIGSARRLRARSSPAGGPVVIVSASELGHETRNFINEIGAKATVRLASSLKFCRLAQGMADVYPRFGPTMEWDTAAGQAVLSAAGGTVTRPDGTEFRYGHAEAGFHNGAFVAWARAPGQSDAAASRPRRSPA